MGGSQNDPLSEFVLKRKLDLEVGGVLQLISISVLCVLMSTQYNTTYHGTMLIVLLSGCADFFQSIVWRVPYPGEAPKGAGVL